MKILYIILGLLALVIVWFVALYNGLITLRNRVKEAWSDIDVQLKRRYDLIPNLVQTIRAYARHEASVFENVAKARTVAMGAKTLKEHAQAENQLTETIKSLFAVAENYPQLQSSQNFLQLQDELSDAENKIQASRRFYNSNVRDFNIKIQQFPNNLVAGIFGFKQGKFFEMTEEREREVPKVAF